jgi:hypothetical protein
LCDVWSEWSCAKTFWVHIDGKSARILGKQNGDGGGTYPSVMLLFVVCDGSSNVIKVIIQIVLSLLDTYKERSCGNCYHAKVNR